MLIAYGLSFIQIPDQYTTYTHICTSYTHQKKLMRLYKLLCLQKRNRAYVELAYLLWKHFHWNGVLFVIYMMIFILSSLRREMCVCVSVYEIQKEGDGRETEWKGVRQWRVVRMLKQETYRLSLRMLEHLLFPLHAYKMFDFIWNM